MTIRLDDSDIVALTGRAPAFSRIPPGHWRCVFAIPDAHVHWVADLPHVWRHFMADEWLWVEESFGSEAAADVRARDIVANAMRARVEGFAYRRAEFFPDYSGASA